MCKLLNFDNYNNCLVYCKFNESENLNYTKCTNVMAATFVHD